MKSITLTKLSFELQLNDKLTNQVLNTELFKKINNKKPIIVKSKINSINNLGID